MKHWASRKELLFWFWVPMFHCTLFFLQLGQLHLSGPLVSSGDAHTLSPLVESLSLNRGRAVLSVSVSQTIGIILTWLHAWALPSLTDGDMHLSQVSSCQVSVHLSLQTLISAIVRADSRPNKPVLRIICYRSMTPSDYIRSVNKSHLPLPWLNRRHREIALVTRALSWAPIYQKGP